MNIDILKMRYFSKNEHAIDVALPVLAIECEVAPPIENYLDAYEETVLKLVRLGLSTNGISNAICATESITETILNSLKEKEYVDRKPGKPWGITEDGKKYLSGEIEERASKESQYGYIFINAIKKEVLPYFHQGDIGRIDLNNKDIPKITIDNDEKITFSPTEIRFQNLLKAYKSFIHNKKIIKDQSNGEITHNEAICLFADIEDFEEEIDDGSNKLDLPDERETLGERRFIRALKREPVKVYLKMRIIIDPSYPGGYRAESPFDMDGIDDNYFIRQIQWLEKSKDVYYKDKILASFLTEEICKLCPTFNENIDFSVFVVEKMPLMKAFRSRFPYVYEDMERIYSTMGNNSLLNRENIVSNLSRYVVEPLFNEYFKVIKFETRKQISDKALDDIRQYGYKQYGNLLCNRYGLNRDALDETTKIQTIVSRLKNTFGNSIVEKYINMMVVDYNLGNEKMHSFLCSDNIKQKYDIICKMNQIRVKVSHETDERFTNDDYDYYMANVFTLINNLLEVYREEL